METLNYKGEARTCIHAYIMKHVTKELIDSMVEDLKAPDAFDDSDDDANGKRKWLMALGNSEANNATANLHEGLIIGENNKGVEKGVKKLLYYPVEGREFL